MQGGGLIIEMQVEFRNKFLYESIKGSWLPGGCRGGSGDIRTVKFFPGGFGAVLDGCAAPAEFIRDWARLDMNYFRNAVSGEGVLFCRDGLGC